MCNIDIDMVPLIHPKDGKSIPNVILCQLRQQEWLLACKLTKTISGTTSVGKGVLLKQALVYNQWHPKLVPLSWKYTWQYVLELFILILYTQATSHFKLDSYVYLFWGSDSIGMAWHRE